MTVVMMFIGAGYGHGGGYGHIGYGHSGYGHDYWRKKRDTSNQASNNKQTKQKW